MTIGEALGDPNLLGQLLGGPTWRPWRACLAALFAEPMSRYQRRIYTECTDRTAPPARQFREAAFVVGRRGGKSRALAMIAMYLACFRDYTKHLAPGEVPTIAIIAADRKQGRVILRYVVGALRVVPLLEPMIALEQAESVRLTNGVVVEIHTGSIASPRGRTFVAVLADEIAFWHSDNSANPDVDVIASVRPGLASIPNSILLMASSPYARRGVLWETYRRHFGRDDARVLVWQANTQKMNPAIDPAVIAEAYEDDPASAGAEYGAAFRNDIAAFADRAVVDSCTVLGRHELPQLARVTYHCFVDPSGGSADPFTLAIAHREGDCGVLDCVRERKPPFSPDDVVREYSDLLATYGIHTIQGDRYAGEWPVAAFRKHGITYEQNAAPKSDLYQQLLPILNSGRCELLDNQRLATQLCALEKTYGARRTRQYRSSSGFP